MARLAFVCNEYPPGPHGGLGTMVQVLGRALVRAGHQVRVVGLAPPAHHGPECEDDEGVQVVRLRTPTGPGGWLLGRQRLFATIRRWACDGAIELVEVPDWEGIAAGWPALPVPVVCRLNGSATYFAAELGRPVGRLTRTLERRSLARADAWCSASRYTAERTRALLRPSRDASAILFNPVELAGPEGAGRDPHVVVFSGTLTEKKGVVQLAEAWPYVVARHPRAELHLYGKDGRGPTGESMRDYLLARLGVTGDHVRFHGHVPRAVLSSALARARVAVFPSYAEAFAVAPVEAMAAGCPTVYSPRGSGRELIDHGHDGLLADPDDVPALAAAVSSVLADDALAARLGPAGRARVARQCALEVVVPRNEAFHAGCIDEFRRRARRAA